jgi:hypothetical protein
VDEITNIIWRTMATDRTPCQKCSSSDILVIGSDLRGGTPLASHRTLWSCIQEVVSSYLGRDTGYPDWCLSYFSSVPQGKYWDNASIWLRSFLSNSSFIHFLLVRRYIVWLLKASLNNTQKSNLWRTTGGV